MESKNKSKSVSAAADQLSDDVKKTIKVSLSGIKLKVAELRGLREIIQGRIDEVNDEFTIFNKEKEVGESFLQYAILNRKCSMKRT